MDQELRQEFLAETIENLTNLQKDLQNLEAETLSEDFLRHFFRRLHSVKGTAQTFGFGNLSRHAHEIENLLQAINVNKIAQSEETTLVIEESLTHLLEFCRDAKYLIPSGFSDKISRMIPDQSKANSRSFLEGKIPRSLLSKLSEQESENLTSALENGKIFYLIEAFFQIAEFSGGFVNFRAVLTQNGEIIAVSPSEKTDSAGEIGFQIFFVSAKSSSEIKEIIATHKAEITFESEISGKSSSDLDGLLSNLIADGRKKARILDKKIAFEISNKTPNIARKNLILINYLLLHLLRNAVDHAIESPDARLAAGKSPEGKIFISVSQNENNLILRVEDDGKGIDTTEVTAQAQKRGVIEKNQILTKDETVNLIFAHGFSTAEIVSDISGRGVGLDVVKDLVENAGGSIKIHTETNRGTIFEIELPA